jgi:hypothetical protein
MRLTWRDGAATVLAALTVMVTLALTQAWSWPLLGSYQAGVVALTIIGVAMCTAGAMGTETPSVTQPFAAIVSVLGVAALGLIIFGLIAATQAPFVALAVVLLAIWFVTTVHHALAGVPGQPARTGA